MLILYKATQHTREVDDKIGARLIRFGIAEFALPDALPRVEPLPADFKMPEVAKVAEVEPEAPAEVLAEKPKRKRRYKRRDMQAGE